MYVCMLPLNISRDFLVGHNALESARKQTKNYIVAPSLWLRTAKSAAHFNNAYGEFPEYNHTSDLNLIEQVRCPLFTEVVGNMTSAVLFW